MNTTLWTLVACVSVTTTLSALVPPPSTRMWRVDVLELRRRHHLIKVLEANTHLTLLTFHPKASSNNEGRVTTETCHTPASETSQA